MISKQAQSYAIELIIDGEGFQSNVYLDTRKHPTIGYGHKLLEHEKGKLTYVTEGQARQMLLSELEEARQCWGNHLNSLGALRTAVILDMTYTMGSVRPDKWPKFNHAVRTSNWEEAAKDIMDSDYAKSRAGRNSAIMRNGQIHKK